MNDELYYNNTLYTFDNLYLFEDNTEVIDTSTEKDEFDIVYPAEATKNMLVGTNNTVGVSTDNKLSDESNNIANDITKLK